MLTEPEHRARPAPATALAALREQVTGTVAEPGSAAYERVVPVWNHARQGRPGAIVLAAGVRDVAHTVRFAREHGLRLAVRGGGYSPAGHGTCDGGLVLDLRHLQRVRVDMARHQVVVGAGARWGDVDVATQRVGQAVPGAGLANIGVAGSTLSGGFGYLRRAYGLACDNLTAASVVSAEGEVLTASGDERPELLWGLRGGGGNFGVATSLTFRLRPLPEPVLSGMIFFPADVAPRLLRFYRDWTSRLREDVTSTLSFLGRAHSPALVELIGLVPSVPVVAVTVVCAGHPVEAEDLLRPLREAGPVLRDIIGPRPYAAFQAMGDPMYPHGLDAMADSGFLDDLADDVLDALVERFAAMPGGACELHLQHMGGAVGRVAHMSTAVPNRDAGYLYSALARWSMPDDEPARREWLVGTGDRLRPLQTGGPHVGLRTAAVSSVQAYGAERYLRLAALKRRFDPDNVFAANQNVRPLI